jgi:hypothetical protein
VVPNELHVYTCRFPEDYKLPMNAT